MIDYDLRKIRLVAFDVDGVLSRETVSMDAQGEPLRTVNIKDGYAIQLAAKAGLPVAIITGGKSQAVKARYERLGVKDFYSGCAVKVVAYEELLTRHGLKDEEVLYMGDDIPDYEVMSRCGCPCCPADACHEIKQVSRYVSSRKGGEGCARDVLEQVMRAQGIWMADERAFGW